MESSPQPHQCHFQAWWPGCGDGGDDEGDGGGGDGGDEAAAMG